MIINFLTCNMYIQVAVVGLSLVWYDIKKVEWTTVWQYFHKILFLYTKGR